MSLLHSLARIVCGLMRRSLGISVAAVLTISFSALALQSGTATGKERGPALAVAASFTCDLGSALGTPGIRVLPSEQLPTHIKIMGTRYWDLTYTLAGIGQTGVSLVAVNGAILGPSGGLDDVGSYFLIPKFAALFGLALPRAIDLFYDTLLGFGFLAGAVGFLVLYEKPLTRTVALVGLSALTVLAYHVGDVYVFFFITPLVATPWTLVLMRRPEGSLLGMFLAVLGVLLGTANAVRSHAGTAALLFSCPLIFFQLSARTSKKLILFLCLLGGMIVPKLFFGREVARRDAFLSAHCPGYGALSARHPMWHVVFLGFGYLQNDYGISWNDEVAYQRVQSVAPGTTYGSVHYEQILRHEVLQLLRQHPWFVFLTVASKLGVVLALVALSVNMGALATISAPKPWAVELSFWTAILFSSIFVLLAIPAAPYSLGLISFAVLYGIVSVGFYLEARFDEPVRALSQR
jgi:hypothetical protein